MRIRQRQSVRGGSRAAARGSGGTNRKMRRRREREEAGVAVYSRARQAVPRRERRGSGAGVGVGRARVAADVVVASSSPDAGEEEVQGAQVDAAGAEKTWEDMSVEERLNAVGFVKYSYDPEERAKTDALAKMWLGWGYDEFDAAIADFIKEQIPPPALGSSVKGTITEVNSNFCAVQINDDNILKCYAEEASFGDLGSPAQIFRRGEVRDFTVIVGNDTQKDRLQLSRLEEEIELAWTRIRQLQAEDITVEAEMVEMTKAGIIVEYEGLQGFIPGSHLSPEYTTERLESEEGICGEKIAIKFLEVDEEGDRLVCSNRRATAEASMSGSKVGDVVAGVVTAVKPFGAFIDIGGINGLLHISQISHDRVTTVDSMLSVGDQVKVMIIAQDRERGRVSLSTKKLEPSPGDMLRNPQLVFDKAEEIAATFRERVAAAEAAARAEEDLLAAQARAALLGEDMPETPTAAGSTFDGDESAAPSS